MSQRSTTGASAASNSARPAGDSTCTRMKKRPVSRLANCWLSVMLPRAATIAPLTACTMPGPSVQASVTTQWNRWAGATSVVIRPE